MTRLVSVAYLVPVHCTVDLDAIPDSNNWYPDDAITRVFQSDEGIFLSDDPIQDAVEADLEDQANPADLTEEERARAIEIAESTIWPAWER